jgi:putative hydrolase of the HAD superfamily
VARPDLSGRRFDAVVFDLYGTLVPEFPRAEFFAAVDAAARVLGADPEAFREAWLDTAIERQTGAYEDGMPGNVRAVCRAIGLDDPPDDLVHLALAPRSELYRRWFHPRPGAADTLRTARERGYPVGLISMCAPDTPPMWRALELAPLVDVAVFSSESGLRKPDAAIYLRCCEGLGVDADRILYCGDGSYGELSGAERVGMAAVEIRDPDVDVATQLRPEAEEWSGPWVGDLRELLAWLPGRAPAADDP